MNILSHSLSSIQPTLDAFYKLADEFISPFNLVRSIDSYDRFFNTLSSLVHALALQLLQEVIETADLKFRNMPGRTQRYYVKSTRQRTIITPFGPLTYTRTQYQDRDTGTPFCPTDLKLGLLPRVRYDALVQSMIVELAAESNSMIKVGKHVGELIHAHYSSDPNRHDFAIPRQTVYNILNRTSLLEPSLPPCQKTPPVLYIMADEKYIPIQQRPADQREKPKRKMCKLAVIFEGREPVVTKNGEKTNRFQLTQKTYVTDQSGTIWEKTLDALSQRYDLDQVEKLYILGDGAPWIANGRITLSGVHPQVIVALDRFHFQQAINRITQNQEIKKQLREAALQDDKDSFKALGDSVIERMAEKKREKSQKNLDYCLDHWTHYQNMLQRVKIGCAMEQEISHVMASVFTSVPKAYVQERLSTYIQHRINFKNKVDLRKLVRDSLNQKLSPNEHSSLNLQICESQKETSSYKVNIDHFTANTIYSF